MASEQEIADYLIEMARDSARLSKAHGGGTSWWLHCKGKKCEHCRQAKKEARQNLNQARGK